MSIRRFKTECIASPANPNVKHIKIVDPEFMPPMRPTQLIESVLAPTKNIQDFMQDTYHKTKDVELAKKILTMYSVQSDEYKNSALPEQAREIMRELYADRRVDLIRIAYKDPREQKKYDKLVKHQKPDWL